MIGMAVIGACADLQGNALWGKHYPSIVSASQP